MAAHTLDGALACVRFGFGARPGEIETASRDPRGYLLGQIDPLDPPDFPDQALVGSKQAFTIFIDRFAGLRDSDDAAERDDARDQLRNLHLQELLARVRFGVETTRPLHERLVRFWSNHFTVAARNPQTTLLAGPFEREAIRPHILGRFRDLLGAATLHPGMLIYLDNWQSIGPNSLAGRRRDLGLNENLARELLELHTVSPAAGYSQNDVTELARALTGHTVGNRRIGSDRLGETLFAPILHEPGVRDVLGRRYTGSGADQVAALLDDLASHPVTAHRIASKLAVQFVADDPPPALVDRLETTFIDSDGDLGTVYRVLIEAPEVWTDTLAKAKTPDELLTSAGRGLGLPRALAAAPRDSFENLAQLPFRAPSPEGWPDRADAWITPDSLMKRIQWAAEVAQRAPGIDARRWLDDVLGPLAGSDTRTAVARAASSADALAIALMSPEFQRR